MPVDRPDMPEREPYVLQEEEKQLENAMESQEGLNNN